MKVRPLKWEEPHPSHTYPTWRAQKYAIRFQAVIDTSRPQCFGKFPLAINGNDVDQKFDSVEDAKAYAQADYDSRILDLFRATLQQGPSAAGGEDKLREAANGLLAQWELFEASHGNQEEAYYKLAKYARPHWVALRAALQQEPTK